MLAYFILYPLVPVKMCEGKLIRYPFLFNDNSMSFKVHCKNPFLLKVATSFVIPHPVECRRPNGYAIIQQGACIRPCLTTGRGLFFNLVGFVCHPERSRGISILDQINNLCKILSIIFIRKNNKFPPIKLVNFISLFYRVFIARWMSIKNKTRRFVYESSRVLASHLFIKNCNFVTKIKGGTYVEKFV